ncbi:hypothetical protein ACHAWX_006982 [Stephanocyclus meneghinianus]
MLVALLIHLASFVVHSLLVSALPQFSTSSFVQRPGASLAFVDKDNSNIISPSQKKKFQCSMSSVSLDEMTDADAYHEMISAAVDLTSVYVRNGILYATRSVRDIDTNSRRAFLYSIPLATDRQSPFIPPPMELPTKIKARIPSPSGNKLAILVEESIPPLESNNGNENKRALFEIWTDGGHRLENRIVLPKEKHGPVCTDFDWFGGIAWSPDETALVYNAEVPSPKTASFFDTSSKLVDGTVAGGQYTLGVGKSENWGEKYISTALLGLFCVNVETGRIGAVENVPMMRDPATTTGGYVLGQAIFSPCGQSVAYTGWDAGGGGDMPRRLGAIYCFQRPCKIYSSPVRNLLTELSKPRNDEEDCERDDGFECITPHDRLARSPRFSKVVNGHAKLAYLCNTKGFDTHGGCMALHVADWNLSQESFVKGSQRIVVDVVSMPGERGDSAVISGISFPGLFLNQLPDQCFSHNLEQIVTTTEWGSTTKVVSISLTDGSVVPINFHLAGNDNVVQRQESSDRFLCFTDDGGAIVAQSEPNRPTVLGYLQPDFLTSGTTLHSCHLLASMPPFSCTSSGHVHSFFRPGTGYSYRVMNVHPPHGNVKVPVGAVLLIPEQLENERFPLIVVPHGGPHACMPTSFEKAGLSYGFLCKHGRYAVLHVNFRGSTGFGQAALESLAGNAGSLDVLDVVAATRAVIEMGFVDPDRVGVCGGSHGGFLAGHLIGQHPNLFKVAAMRNPCTNIASMVTATDIPDWCYIETLGTG